MKEKRRSAICGRNQGTGKREGRKSDIFASLDREKETVEVSAGPLMRQLPSRAKSSSTDRMVRPLIMRQGPTRSENTGPVFGVSSGNTLRRPMHTPGNRGALDDTQSSFANTAEAKLKNALQQRKEQNAGKLADLQKGTTSRFENSFASFEMDCPTG
jgi:hypothetical protein